MITCDGREDVQVQGQRRSAPTEIVERYGADTARCYILFIGPAGPGRGLVRQRRQRASTASWAACGVWLDEVAERAASPDGRAATRLVRLRKAH